MPIEMPENKAAQANAALARVRATPHNGKMYQADDVEYLLALAETQGRGLGAINPKWFVDQARLVKGTLDRVAELEKERADLDRRNEKLLHALTSRNAELEEAERRITDVTDCAPHLRPDIRQAAFWILGPPSWGSEERPEQWIIDAWVSQRNTEVDRVEKIIKLVLTEHFAELRAKLRETEAALATATGMRDPAKPDSAQ